ncbi:MAG TPA: hypothetical protein VJL84_01400 [Kiloniellales bacterium]|nr:hypothetical protein [Kiloniellales bacterium]
MRRRRLVILVHQYQGLDENCGINRLARDFWEPAGWEIVVHQGLRDPPDADVAVLHVDMTVVPDEYMALAARYPVCINGQVRDVSKRVVSRSLVGRDDSYDGPVMVKTDRNCGGKPERLLRLAMGGRRARWAEVIERRLPPRWTGRLKDDEYLLFASKSAVPAWVWRRPELVVERFMEQREGALYTINQWQFLGGSGVVLTYYGTDPVVKYMRQVRQDPVHDRVPEEIRALRAELKIDYGKFDFIVTTEGARLLDANRTPWTPRPPTDPRLIAMAKGLEGFLRRRR